MAGNPHAEAEGWPSSSQEQVPVHLDRHRAGNMVGGDCPGLCPAGAGTQRPWHHPGPSAADNCWLSPTLSQHTGGFPFLTLSLVSDPLPRTSSLGPSSSTSYNPLVSLRVTIHLSLWPSLHFTPNPSKSSILSFPFLSVSQHLSTCCMLLRLGGNRWGVSAMPSPRWAVHGTHPPCEGTAGSAREHQPPANVQSREPTACHRPLHLSVKTLSICVCGNISPITRQRLWWLLPLYFPTSKL